VIKGKKGFVIPGIIIIAAIIFFVAYSTTASIGNSLSEVPIWAWGILGIMILWVLMNR